MSRNGMGPRPLLLAMAFLWSGAFVLMMAFAIPGAVTAAPTFASEASTRLDLAAPPHRAARSSSPRRWRRGRPSGSARGRSPVAHASPVLAGSLVAGPGLLLAWLVARARLAAHDPRPGHRAVRRRRDGRWSSSSPAARCSRRSPGCCSAAPSSGIEVWGVVAVDRLARRRRVHVHVRGPLHPRLVRRAAAGDRGVRGGARRDPAREQPGAPPAGRGQPRPRGADRRPPRGPAAARPRGGGRQPRHARARSPASRAISRSSTTRRSTRPSCAGSTSAAWSSCVGSACSPRTSRPRRSPRTGTCEILPELLDVESQLAESAGGFPGLDLRIDCQPGLVAWADPLRLQQILSNLIRNAERHGAEPVVVRVRSEPDGMVVFRVTDAGPGVSETFIPRLFERYSQGPDSAPGGSGLGLSVTRDLVRAHGGTVRYDLTDPAFIVTLPAAPTEIRTPNGRVISPPPSHAAASAGRSRRGGRGRRSGDGQLHGGWRPGPGPADHARHAGRRASCRRPAGRC